jgi:hypothetical protein
MVSLFNKNRHPELFSGSISPKDAPFKADKWMLKQAQHDDTAELPFLCQ